jgi:hypothetical protein
MATIKATCPSCRITCDVQSDQVLLRVCSNDPTRSYYAFPCGECGVQRKPADEHVIALLATGTVRREDWQLPAEMLDKQRFTRRPALTVDDVLDLVLTPIPDLMTELASLDGQG